MSISIYSMEQNISDLNSYKESLPKEVKDAIERVADDFKEVKDIADGLLSNIKR